MSEKMDIRKIGVLTSGGDAPGMNAAVRAVVRTALSKGLEVVTINNGYEGLMNRDFKVCGLRDVSEIIVKGGTVLFSARSKRFNSPEGIAQAVSVCREEGIDGLVVIGGDGSFRGAKDLSEAGVPCVGIPGTIDNDIACSDYTIGFDTALNTAMVMIDALRDTMQSHGRCSVVQVMGRHAGHLAVNVGIACGACAILVPEYSYDFDKDIKERLIALRDTGKRNYIIIVAEGVMEDDPLLGVHKLADRITNETGIEARGTILGHIQRGGSPTTRDRVIGTNLGRHAVELLANGCGNRVVAVQNDNIVDYDIQEALAMKKVLSKELYETAKIVSI